MEMRFIKVFDFNMRSADKLFNSSYLEKLTELLSKAASKMNDENNYFFGSEYYLAQLDEDPNSNFKDFIEDFKRTIYYSAPQKINIIRGRAGIGKTLFFKHGIRKLIRDTKNKDDKYIYIAVDFKNIDNDLKIEDYENWIYKRLYMNAIDSILQLGEEISNIFDNEFQKFGKYDCYHKWLYPLEFFCEKILQKYNVPCIIVFDNIDLASVLTQMNVLKATSNVCDKFNELMRIHNSPDCYRIYFAIRPEVEIKYIENSIGAIINFPLPNILKITLAVLKKVLITTANGFEKEFLPCHITCNNVMKEDEVITFEKFTDIAEYFYTILDHYLNNIWQNNPQVIERMGTCEEFHCNIVNYNLRTFQSFLSDTISNGGFKPLTRDFNKNQGHGYYSVYDYIEMIIRGRWTVHPGNKHINGEGSNSAPIVFNIFETSLYGNTQKTQVKHFMLNIRILQYFFLCGDNFDICYQDMQNTLSLFFEVDQIRKATQQLIYVRFLYSYNDGDNAIASKQNYQEIQIIDTAKYRLSPVGRFYLEQLICEFEYLYQMSLSSLMYEPYTEEIKQCWKTEKEKTVLYFLKSIFKILQINITDYNPVELTSFKNMFYFVDDIRGSKPFRRMLDRFISVMHNKVQRAEKMDTNNIIKLNNILKEANELKEESLAYFAVHLGE